MTAARLGVALCLLACGGRSTAPPPDDAVLVIETNVAGADVWANGAHVFGLRGTHGTIRIRPGHHRIEVRVENYFPMYVDVTVTPRERKQLKIELAERLP